MLFSCCNLDVVQIAKINYTPKMSLITIKVKKIDFKAAEDNGFVHGRDLNSRVNNLPPSVLVELGEEKEYDYSDRDDPSIEYRLFKGCTIFYGYNDDDVDNEVYFAIKKMRTIRIHV